MITEKQEQARIVELFRALRGTVYVSGTVRRAGDYPGTMQTPGIPDLAVFLPAPRAALVGGDTHVFAFVEVKRAGGRLGPAQRVFRDYCEASGIEYVSGTLDDVLAWLKVRGYRIAA